MVQFSGPWRRFRSRSSRPPVSRFWIAWGRRACRYWSRDSASRWRRSYRRLLQRGRQLYCRERDGVRPDAGHGRRGSVRLPRYRRASQHRLSGTTVATRRCRWIELIVLPVTDATRVATRQVNGFAARKRRRLTASGLGCLVARGWRCFGAAHGAGVGHAARACKSCVPQSRKTGAAPLVGPEKA